jgi:hypothetical protein
MKNMCLKKAIKLAAIAATLAGASVVAMGGPAAPQPTPVGCDKSHTICANRACSVCWPGEIQVDLEGN